MRNLQYVFEKFRRHLCVCVFVRECVCVEVGGGEDSTSWSMSCHDFGNYFSGEGGVGWSQLILTAKLSVVSD